MGSSETPLRVLVVEDDELAAEYIQLHLVQLGCSVELARDGEAGLIRLCESRFDLLISDWMMPRMDGIELIRRARGEIAHYMHVVLLTAQGEERTMSVALEAGADDFLYKPITPVQLQLALSTARRVLGLQRRLERRNRALAKSMLQVRQAYRQLKVDVEAAASMQLSLIPLDGITGEVQHASLFRPSVHMGGDSVGVSKVGGGTFFFSLDVSGHGVPAALNSFALHQRLLKLAREHASASEIAGTINLELVEQSGDSYATALIGFARGNRLEVVRCGHPPPLLLSTGGCQVVEDGSLPLGLFSGARFEVSVLEFEAGDRLICYSDGVLESGMDEQEFNSFFSARRNRPLNTCLSDLQATLDRLRESETPTDDISVIAIQRTAESARDRD